MTTVAVCADLEFNKLVSSAEIGAKMVSPQSCACERALKLHASDDHRTTTSLLKLQITAANFGQEATWSPARKRDSRTHSKIIASLWMQMNVQRAKLKLIIKAAASLHLRHFSKLFMLAFRRSNGEKMERIERTLLIKRPGKLSTNAPNTQTDLFL